MALDFKTLFDAHLRSVRERHGLTQESLATLAGLHVTHISLLERGRRSAQIETVEKLARALHVQPSELMPTIQLVRAAAIKRRA